MSTNGPEGLAVPEPAPDPATEAEAQPAKYPAWLAPAPKDAVLSVPEAAVVHTGTRTEVNVETGPGVFEERGRARSAQRRPVLQWVSDGERVAATGSFLTDAATRLSPAAGASYFGASGTPAGGAKAPAPAPDKQPSGGHGHRTASRADGLTDRR